MNKKRVATIILNRNLPEVTDSLVEQLEKYDGELSDFYVVESGSSPDKLSKYCSWHANDAHSLENGLRYPRGFNYGLNQLWQEGKFKDYDYFFLCCNDIEFPKEPIISKLVEIIDKQDRLGIIAPCSELWGEKSMIPQGETKYFWDVQFLSWLVKRPLIEDIMEAQDPNMMNFFFDGNNFRGYYADLEVIAKAYANDWAAAITTDVWQIENDSHLRSKSDLMKTDPYDVNLKRVFAEGKLWLRRKYGFNSRWSMQSYAKFFYEEFFKHYPEFNSFNILQSANNETKAEEATAPLRVALEKNKISTQ